jgi:putative transposase
LRGWRFIVHWNFVIGASALHAENISCNCFTAWRQLNARAALRSEGARAGSHGWSAAEPVDIGNRIRFAPEGRRTILTPMPGTYHCLKFHLIFSTKNRERWLTDSVRGRIHDYLGGIIRGERGVPLGIGGVEDHVHILFSWRTDEAISDLVRNVKANSSKWIHETFSELRIFAWQEGYAIFSVSESQVEKVRAFIERQPEHHRKKSFKEEIGDFLRAHRVDHDPGYLWD